MNLGMFDDGRDKVMCKVFEWAYENGIEIKLRSVSHYDGGKHPELVFRRGDKNLAVAFWPLTDLTAKLDHEWRKIALELCVAPLKLEKFL